MKTQLKNLTNFTNDLVLMLFLMAIVSFGFFAVLGFSPQGIQDESEQVLGKEVTQTNQLILTPLLEDNSESQVTITTQKDNSIELNIKTLKAFSNDLSIPILKINNTTNTAKEVRVLVDVPQNYLKDERYTVKASGSSFSVYDDRGDQQLYGTTVTVAQGTETTIYIEVHGYSPINYTTEFTASISY